MTQYDYDINGNIKKITDANAHATDYGYDGFDRPLTLTYADTKFTEFEYDKNSNVKKVTQGKPLTPRAVEYDYDAINRVIAKRFPATAALNTAYQYDLGSRLSLATNAQQVVGYFYNNLDQVWVAGQIYGNNQLALIVYGHDKVGNRKSVTYPSGKLVEYVYDAADRLHQVKVNGILIDQHDRDLLGRRSGEIRYLSPTVKTETGYGFDIADQLQQIVHSDVAGVLLAQFDYPVYDNAGNRMAFNITRPGGNLNIGYGYNNIYELTSVSGSQTHTYQYDLVGNRLNVDGTVYVPNAVNQYATVGTQAYNYDHSGNLTNDGVNTYTYDEENRLSGVPNANATYTYDGLNRRVSKTVNGVATYFIYDGDREIEERDANGTLLADYVFGGNIDEVLTMTRSGQTYHYYYDGLGSVTDLMDTNGNVVESYDYDAYGQPSALSTIGNPFYFTGRRYDPESGKQHQRRRTYDPSLGRFFQRDPIGNDDSENLYHYTFNNPTNNTDPTGQIVDTLADIGFIGYDLYRLASDYTKGCKDNLKENLSALGGDVAGAFIPGLTGVGLGIRAVKTGEKVVGTTIKGFTKHGIDRAIQRGVKPSEILDAVRNPQKIKSGRNGVTRYIGKDAEVRINSSGEVVTVIRFKKPTVP